MKQFKQTIAGTKTYELLTVEDGRAEIQIVYSDGTKRTKFSGGAGDGIVSQFIHNALPVGKPADE
jgi:hypothetical protein